MKLTRTLVVVLAVVLVAGCTPKPTKKTAPEAATPAAQTVVPVVPAKTAVPFAEVWTCPMHPEVKEDKAGKCPKCGMDLVKAPAPTPVAAPKAQPAPAPAPVPPTPAPAPAAAPAQTPAVN